MASTTAMHAVSPERTPAQRRGGVAGFAPGLAAGPRPPAGTFAVYRQMRANPTIALGRLAATAPLRAAPWSLEVRADAPPAWAEFIRRQMTAVWPMLVNDALYALDYGFQAFEKVFEVRDGQIVFRKLKPLAPEMTEVLVDAATGSFAGLRQGEVVLDPPACFLFTVDGETGNYYGRSRHENVREHAWAPWMELSRKRSQYFNKVAGVVPVIEYPEGEGRDAAGAVRSNFDLARSVLQNLGEGRGVAMPNVLAPFAGDLARSGADIQQLRAWHISFLETREQHGSEFSETMRHLESLMLRGWLVPERSATEGQHGTRADAGEHARLAMQAGDLLLQDLLRHVNWYLVNPLLVLNFGPGAEGAVELRRAALEPAQRDFFRGVIERLLAGAGSGEGLAGMLDLQAMLDAAGLPRKTVNAPQAGG